MSRYVKKTDRLAMETKAKLQAGLQAIADDPNATRDQRLGALSKIADLQIVEQRSASRVGPLQEQIDQQARKLREMRAELATANEQLVLAHARIAELEKQNSELVIERDGMKSDIGQLGSRIVLLNNENRRALSAEVGTRRELETLTASAGRLRFSVATLAKHVNLSAGFIQELFFRFFDQLAPEVFIDLGWSTQKIEFWSRWYSRAKNSPSDKLIDLLHRQDCPCTGHGQQPTTLKDQDGLRPIADDDREFITGLLKSRSVDVELEVGKLVATHREQWMQKNRPELRLTPPLSHRQITPVAGARVVNWGED